MDRSRVDQRATRRKIHNTAIAFSPDGEIAAVYRKLFPWRPFEDADPGAEPAPVFTIPGKGVVGMMICYDGWFPEVARGLALQGAELIAQPTATTTPDREEEVVLARANAIVNQVFVFNPNMVSTFGPGRSVSVDPEGRVLFEAGAGEELLVEVVDMDRVAEIRRRGTRGVTRPWRHFLDGPGRWCSAPTGRVAPRRRRSPGSRRPYRPRSTRSRDRIVHPLPVRPRPPGRSRRRTAPSASRSRGDRKRGRRARSRSTGALRARATCP